MWSGHTIFERSFSLDLLDLIDNKKLQWFHFLQNYISQDVFKYVSKNVKNGAFSGQNIAWLVPLCLLALGAKKYVAARSHTVTRSKNDPNH